MSVQASEGAAEWSGRAPLESEEGERPEAPAGAAAELALLWSSLITARSASGASWVANVFLLVAKAVIFALSNSKAVLAALADSAVDIASQFILELAERYTRKHDARYPVGRARLEALAVIGCSSIMSFASIEVVQFSCVDLYKGVRGTPPEISLGPVLYGLLAAGVVVKLLLWLACRSSAAGGSDTLAALAEDHLNDVWSNTAAVITGALASRFKSVWWLDPAAGIVISVLIIMRWTGVTLEQVKKIAGAGAPPEFVERVNRIAVQHESRLAVDVTRAYHFGSRFNVEMEIVLPAEMTVAESHDIGLELQHKIEQLEDVERCFIHIDYQSRDQSVPEHKVERELLLASLESSSSALGTAVTFRGARSQSATRVADAL